MAVEVRPLKPTSNENLLDRLRYEGSSDYQRRIPEATKAGVQSTLKALQENRPLFNEFLDALVNRVGLVISRNKAWTNPLAGFKRGMLNYGDTIEEIQVGLIKAKTYDPDRESLEKDIFGTHRPDVQANFHKVNRQDVYPITINDALLTRAFLEPGGLSAFITQLMEAPSTSDQWDEFLITCQLFSEYESNGGFHKVQVPDVARLESSADDAKGALRKMRAHADKLTFLSTHYNAAKMPTFATRDELVLFVSPEFNAAVDVEALAGAFNMEKSAMHGRVVPIPQENFGIDGAQALMTTSDFFVMADQRFETTSAFNPRALHNNYFLHRWEVISASRFAPSVLFTTKTGDEIITLSTPVTAVSAVTAFNREGDQVTEVDRGYNYAFYADAITDPVDGVNDGVRWSVTNPTSAKTYITQTGVLHVSGWEDAASLTVTATSTWLDADNVMRDGETASLTVTVSGVAAPEWPESDPVTGIMVDGVAVTPAFDPAVYAYTVTVPALPVTEDDVVVTGPDTGDVIISVNDTGNVVTITAPSAPGDPVYTVTASTPV